MMNVVVLVGRITKDPELRFINNDIPLVRFTLAVGRNFVNSSGNKETDFIRCVVWRKQAENLAKYIVKGALLGIEGSIRVNSFENENEQKQFLTEINCNYVQFLESKKDNNKYINDNSENFLNKDNKENNNISKYNKNMEEIEIEEDDGLPF
jgi:single-strand DNA-binding protein